MKLAFVAGLFLAGQSIAQDLVSALQSQEDLSTLLSALEAVPELAQQLAISSNITILAPTNEAFEAVFPDSEAGIALANMAPNDIATLLSYHVLNGTYMSTDVMEAPMFVHSLLLPTNTLGGSAVSNVTEGQNVGFVMNEGEVNVLSGELMSANVTEADIQVGEIIIHKIDAVLSIPLNVSQQASQLSLTGATGALVEAGLVDILDTIEDLTVFVPNNEAFQAAASAFEGADMQTLQSVLQYHAVMGSVVFSSDVMNTTVESVQGGELTLSVVDGTVFVNQARVVIPNVLLSNGVMHVIDTVLNPEASDVDRDELDPEAEPTPAFSDATSATEVPFTTAAPPVTTTNSVPESVETGAAVPPSSSEEEEESQETAGAVVHKAAGSLVGAGALFAGFFGLAM